MTRTIRFAGTIPAAVLATACASAAMSSQVLAKETCRTCGAGVETSGPIQRAFPAREVRRGVASFELRGVVPKRILAARLSGPRHRRLSLHHARTGARRGVIRIRVSPRSSPAWTSRRARRLKLRVVVAPPARASDGRKKKGSGTKPPPTGGTVPPSPPTDTWRLAFVDDFEQPQLDQSKWWWCFTWATSACPHGSELQLYNPEDVYTENGVLRMRAQKRDMLRWNGQLYHYTSGMAITGGNPVKPPGFTFTYGRAEARIRVPKGQGLWPAFWMLPASRPADSLPEVDIVEILDSAAHDTNKAHFHIHHAGGAPGSTYTGPDFALGWHTFAVDWQPDKIVWYVDGVERWRYTGPGIPQEAMYLMLNLAVGGSWPGPPDATTVFPSYFDVDYVRVWQRT